MLNWHLVYTKPRNEDVVSYRFNDAAMEVFNPKIRERRVIRRKLQTIITPLFPCYIFVKFDMEENYRLVKYTRGVRRIVGCGNAPQAVPEDIISSIKERMEEGVINLSPVEFKAGEDVVVKDGPFRGLQAIFEREMKETERVSILLKEINARVVVDRAFLVKG